MTDFNGPNYVAVGGSYFDLVGEDGELVEFEYSNRKASYLGERLRSGGVVTAVDPATGTATVDLHIKNAQGAVISPGRAVVRLRA